MQNQPKIATVTLNPALDQTVAIDDFHAGTVNRVSHSRLDPGGKGINVATALADLGYQVVATGFLGKANPEMFERHFSARSIEDRLLRIEGATRIGIKIVDGSRDETTDINFPGPAPTAEDEVGLFATIEELTASCDWFVLAGSIPAGVAPDIYARLVTLIHDRGASVALDTSGEPLRLALERAPELIKPNTHELEELTGRPLPDREAIAEAGSRLLAKGVKTVVVSMGETGALFLEPEQSLFASPLAVEVRSTVGAGDAMLSGALAGTIRRASLADCARLATGCAAAAVGRVGAGLPSPAELEVLVNRVEVHELKTRPNAAPDRVRKTSHTTAS